MSVDDSDRAGSGIDSRGAFLEAARAMLLQAQPVGTRAITLVDTDFSPWPLDDEPVIDALTRWVRLPGRRLRLVGSRFDVIERDQPRFAAWRKPFVHAIECLRPTDVDPADLPSVLLFDTSCLELLDREHWTARATRERRALVLQRERLDALMQRCEAAWPVTVLGL
jgi:hypothetical protein